MYKICYNNNVKIIKHLKEDLKKMFTKRFKIITVFLTVAIIASIVAACGKDVIETTGHDVENVSEEVQKVIEEYREETGKDPTEEEVKAILSDKIEHVHDENCSHSEVTSESVNEEEVNTETPETGTIAQPGEVVQKPATSHVVTDDSSETEVSSSSSANKENESSKPSVTPKPVDTKPTEKPSDSGSSSKPETHTHSYGAWVTTKNATCASEGKQERTCSCGKKETKAIAKTSSHTWNSGSVTKEATTTSTGVKTYTCTACGTTRTETIPKKEATVAPKPTVHTHSYGSWATTKNATCTADGIQERTCSCGQKETKSIPKTGHSYGSWSISGSNQVRKCSKCGNQESKPAGKKWVVDVPYQAAVYDELETWAERPVFWVKITAGSQKDDPGRTDYLYEYFSTYQEARYYIDNVAYPNWTYVGNGSKAEVYLEKVETVLVTPEVQEQGHWEYFVQ